MKLIIFCVVASFCVFGFAKGNERVFYRPRARSQAVSPTCAKIGEYCQVHSQCCTNNCLSFEYKCIRNLSSVNIPSVVHSQSVEPEKRFGDECSANGDYCQLSSQCCSGRCLSFEYKCVPKRQQSRPVVNQDKMNLDDFIDSLGNSSNVCKKQSEACKVDNECCSLLICDNTNNVCVTANNMNNHQLANRVSLGSTEITTNSTSVDTCNQIGDKCYRNDDCCTKRCHGYIHQCVS